MTGWRKPRSSTAAHLRPIRLSSLANVIGADSSGSWASSLSFRHLPLSATSGGTSGARATPPGQRRTTSDRRSNATWRACNRPRPPERVVSVPGRAIAIIRIPKIDVDLVVVEGTGTEQLKKGPGHYPWTAYPWDDTGRVGIAGHRTTYGAPFWSLNGLRAGDRIVLATEYGIFDYRVTRTVVTPPSGILPSGAYILDQTTSPTLVLTTCNPRFSASERLVVIADRVE